LLDSSSGTRRKFLDWGVFHVEHNFINDWKSYKKILGNRNEVLKKFKIKFKSLDMVPQNQLNDLNCWSPQLIHYNNKITNYRDSQLTLIKKNFFELLNLFSSDLCEKINIFFSQGWSSSLSYNEYLINKINHDINSGYTRYGAHRSDIIINYQNMPANDILSRGQKKIVIICLILSQFSYLKNKKIEEHHLLLLDDMDSELDEKNLKILFSILENLNSQVIATTTDIKKYKFICNDCKLFHVKQD